MGRCSLCILGATAAFVTTALGLATTTPARADCPPSAPEAVSSVLTNCTFSVPSSVKAPDIPRVLRGIIKPIRNDLFALAKAASAPVVSKDIKDGAIRLRDLSSGVQAAIAQAGTTPGPPGQPGQPGAPGGALAYARVDPDGSIDPSASKDIALVSANNGIYCLRYTTGSPHIITTTVDISGADGKKVIVAGTAVKAAIDAGGSCSSDTNIEVVTSTATTQSTTPASFYIVVTI